VLSSNDHFHHERSTFRIITVPFRVRERKANRFYWLAAFCKSLKKREKLNLFQCVLYQPEIPPNTGSIIRLCANAGVQLHLIHPLGFDLDDKKLRRAGLDYHEWVRLQEHESLAAFLEMVQPPRLFACSTRGKMCYADQNYQAGDVFLFGPETRGLPQTVLDELPPERVIRIPMHTGNRSLNLSNAVAVIIYEAWRQLGFEFE